MCGLSTDKKTEPVRPNRDGERASVEGLRDRAPEADDKHDVRADGEQPRLAKRPPGRLPTR